MPEITRLTEYQMRQEAAKTKQAMKAARTFHSELYKIYGFLPEGLWGQVMFIVSMAAGANRAR